MNVSEQTHVDIIENAESQRVRVAFVDRGRIALLEDHHWMFGGQLRRIPIGFESDGASIPAWAWAIVGHPFSGSSLKAALLHDWALRQRIADSAPIHRWFYQRLRTDGCAWLRSVLMYAAVRLFGPRYTLSPQEF